MNPDTFRKWLTERGCTFEQHERAKGGLGHATVTVRREGRRSELPMVGTKKDLDPDVVRRIVEDLDLPYGELPGPQDFVSGPKSRV
jgi:hypothetical protein